MYRCISAIRCMPPLMQMGGARSFTKVINTSQGKPKRELKLIDMIANLDDAVAVCVLAKIPFADKIHIERALPFIYSFCGYRSGTGENRY